MSDLYRPNDLLCFGRVIQVDGSTVAIQLDQGINDLTRSYQGRLYSIGQIGSVIKLLNGRRVLFASVRSLRLETDDDVHQITKSIDPKSESRTLLADLLGQGTWNGTDLEFHRGISEYPLPRQQAYLVTAEELEGLYRGAEANRGQTDEISAEIGTYSGASSARCHASIDKFFGHHAAIVGSTGSGKSCAVAALIHSVLNEAKLHPRIIILDPHGEYATAFGDKAQVFRAYSRSDQNDDHEVIKLPFWLLSSDEFRSLIIGKTEHEATAQDNIVHKALLHSRLVGANFIEPARSWVAKPIIADGSLPEDPRPLSPTLASTVNGFDRDRPISFSLDEFERHIVDEQMTVVKNGNYSSIAPSDDHGKRCRSVINKLKVLRRDQRLSFLMNPGDFSLSHVLAQFTGVIPGTSEKPIRIIDLSGTPNEIAGVLTSLIARLLMEVKIRQTNAEIDRDPVVLLCEEAHRYVPEAGEAQYREAQNAVRRIAKEGRKYGVSLVVVSQRPSELDQTVLSQCGSWIVLRLTNGFDQALIKRVLPDHLGGLTEMLSSLGRQEALFLGDAAALPARIRLLDLPIEKRPRSQDRSFSKGWCDVGLSQIDFDRIASRWRGMPTESALAMVEPRIAAGENSQQSTTFHRAAEDDPPF